jgi:hypothetical protein
MNKELIIDDDEPPNLWSQLLNRCFGRVFRSTGNAGSRSMGESCFRRIGRSIGFFNDNDCEASRYYLVCYGGSFLWMLCNDNVRRKKTWLY